MGWLSKAWGGIKKGAEIGSLIPGVNVVAGPLAAGMNLAQAGKNISQGNWKGALGSTLRGLPGAGSIPGVGGRLGAIGGGIGGALKGLPGAGMVGKAAGAYKNLPGWGKELGKFGGIAALSALGGRAAGNRAGALRQNMGGPTQGRLKGLYGQQFAGGGWIYPGMDGGGVITTLGDTPSGEEFVIPEGKYMEYMRRVQEERDNERAMQDSAWAEALQETPSFQGGAYAAHLPRFQRGIQYRTNPLTIGREWQEDKLLPASLQPDTAAIEEVLRSSGMRPQEPVSQYLQFNRPDNDQYEGIREWTGEQDRGGSVDWATGPNTPLSSQTIGNLSEAADLEQMNSIIKEQEGRDLQSILRKMSSTEEEEEEEATGWRGFLKKYGPQMMIAGGMLGGSLFGGDKFRVNRPNRRAFPTRAAAGAIVDTNGSPLDALVAEAGEREFVGDFPAVRDQLKLERHEIPRVLSMPQFQGGVVASDKIEMTPEMQEAVSYLNRSKEGATVVPQGLIDGREYERLTPEMQEAVSFLNRSGEGPTVVPGPESESTLGMQELLSFLNRSGEGPTVVPQGYDTKGTPVGGQRDPNDERYGPGVDAWYPGRDQMDPGFVIGPELLESLGIKPTNDYGFEIRREWVPPGDYPGERGYYKWVQGTAPDDSLKALAPVPEMQGGGIATGGSPLDILLTGLKDAVINSIDDPNRQGKNSFVPAMLKAYDEINKFKGAGMPQFQAGAQITGANPGFVDTEKQALVGNKQSQPGYFENLQGPDMAYGTTQTRTGTPGSGGVGGSYTGESIVEEGKSGWGGMFDNLRNFRDTSFAAPATDSITGTKGSELATVPNFNARNIAQNISSAYGNMAAARGQTGRFNRAGQTDDRFDRGVQGAFADRALQEAASQRADYQSDVGGWQAQDASDRAWAGLDLGAEQARGPGMWQNLAGLGTSWLANRWENDRKVT